MAKLDSAYMTAGALRRVWRNAGTPVDGTSGTYANICEIGDLLIDSTGAKLYQNTNTVASPTWTERAASVALGVVGNMAANGTSTANTVGVGTTAAPIDHVHKIGTHDHSDATKGSTVAMGVVGSMAAAGTSTANAAGTGTAPAAIDHAHALGAHTHAGSTTGAQIGPAAFAANVFTNDAAGRAPFTDAIWTGAKLAVGILSADATGRALFAAGVLDVTTFQSAVAAGVLSADVTGRALMATGYFIAATVLAKFGASSFDATACASVFADNAIPGSKVNWSYGVTASTITPDDSASAGTAATVSRSDHVHANTCAAPANGSLAAANAEGSATSFSRSDHAHRAVLNDSLEIEFGTTYDAVIGWQVGDADNETLVIGLADANQALHIADKSAIGTNWNVAADTHPSLYIHSDTTPATDYLWMWHDGTTGNIHSIGGNLSFGDGAEVVNIGSTAVVFNDGSADTNFRIESNGMEFAFYVDGGKDALVLGSNTDTSSVDQLITISRAARTATANVNYADLWLAPAGAVTIPAGVTAVVATAYILEPNITATGTVTDAACLYVGAAPTEGGTGNYSIMAAGSIGLIADALDLVIGAGKDVLLRWSTGDADNHAFAVGLGASLAMHICQGADIATDWNVAAAVNPTLYIHGATTPATEYVALSTDETDAHLNAVGANWKFEIAGTAELTLSASALNLVDSLLYGSAAAHTADTADACLYLRSTSNAAKGFVCIANAELGLVIGSDGSVDRDGTVGTNSIHVFNGTAPVGALTNGISIYSAAGECYILDAAGNATLQSQHDADGDLIMLHYSAKQKKTRRIYIEKLLHALAADPKYAGYFEETAGLKHNKEW